MVADNKILLNKQKQESVELLFDLILMFGTSEGKFGI